MNLETELWSLIHVRCIGLLGVMVIAFIENLTKLFRFYCGFPTASCEAFYRKKGIPFWVKDYMAFGTKRKPFVSCSWTFSELKSKVQLFNFWFFFSVPVNNPSQITQC